MAGERTIDGVMAWAGGCQVNHGYSAMIGVQLGDSARRAVIRGPAYSTLRAAQNASGGVVAQIIFISNDGLITLEDGREFQAYKLKRSSAALQ